MYQSLSVPGAAEMHEVAQFNNRGWNQARMSEAVNPEGVELFSRIIFSPTA